MLTNLLKRPFPRISAACDEFSANRKFCVARHEILHAAENRGPWQNSPVFYRFWDKWRFLQNFPTPCI